MSEDDKSKGSDSSGGSRPPRRRRRRSRRRPGKGGDEGAPREAGKRSRSSGGSRGRGRRRKRPADGDGSAGSPASETTASGEAGSQDPSRKRRRRRRGRGRGRAGASREGAQPRSEGRRSRRRGHEPATSHGEPHEAPRNRAPHTPIPVGGSEVDLGWDDSPGIEPEADELDLEAEGEDDGARYGDDSDAPTPNIVLTADLPSDPPADDPDPVTAEMEEAVEVETDVRNVVGVRFARAAKIYLYDGGESTYRRGETVILEGERGTRVGAVAVGSIRRPHRDPPLRRILRRADPNDQRAALRAEQRARETLLAARDQVRSLGLHIKVFRAEAAQSGRKVRLYFSSEERSDFRSLIRELSRSMRTRIEVRQTGVRDQAKMVGGIGSCGRSLCCSTWLPDFVPVSIKNAKDQGLVLNPSKVSGQCGRLKCCLVYEQEAYAELRKGLPKMGKRVITQSGEGRVVEVDVLKQRVRVSLTSGESMVFGKGEVEPMFPSQKPKKPRRKQQTKSEPEQAPASKNEE